MKPVEKNGMLAGFFFVCDVLISSEWKILGKGRKYIILAKEKCGHIDIELLEFL